MLKEARLFKPNASTSMARTMKLMTRDAIVSACFTLDRHVGTARSEDADLSNYTNQILIRCGLISYHRALYGRYFENIHVAQSIHVHDEHPRGCDQSVHREVLTGLLTNCSKTLPQELVQGLVSSANTLTDLIQRCNRGRSNHVSHSGEVPLDSQTRWRKPDRRRSRRRRQPPHGTKPICSDFMTRRRKSYNLSSAYPGAMEYIYLERSMCSKAQQQLLVSRFSLVKSHQNNNNVFNTIRTHPLPPPLTLLPNILPLHDRRTFPTRRLPRLPT